MSEPLYVDPEGLRDHARPYEAAAQDWRALGQYIGSIRTRYYGAWGDDDLGNKFGPTFVAGLEGVETGTLNLGETLGYYGEGLVQSGEIYGEARDDANQTSYRFLTDANQFGHAAPPQAQYAVTEQQPVLRRAMAVRSEYAPGVPAEGRVQAAMRLRAPMALRSVRPNEDGTVPLQPLFASRRLAVEGVLPTQPAFRARRAMLAGEPIEPVEPLVPLRPMLAPIPRAVRVDPPPGAVWSDGHWVYRNGSQPVALRDLDSPYDHGAIPTPYEPGTVPHPARGPLPPPGEFWSDGVYLYSSDHGVLAIDQLDSPYDHV